MTKFLIGPLFFLFAAQVTAASTTTRVSVTVSSQSFAPYQLANSSKTQLCQRLQSQAISGLRQRCEIAQRGRLVSFQANQSSCYCRSSATADRKNQRLDCRLMAFGSCRLPDKPKAIPLESARPQKPAQQLEQSSVPASPDPAEPGS